MLSPFSWIFSWFNRGAPLIQQQGAVQEMRLQTEQVQGKIDDIIQKNGVI